MFSIQKKKLLSKSASQRLLLFKLEQNKNLIFLNLILEEEDDDGTEGIQQKHRKHTLDESDGTISSGSSDNSEDEDFLGRKSGRKLGVKRGYKGTPGPGRPAGSGATQRPQRRTIKQLTESGILSRLYDDSEESDGEDDLNIRHRYDNDSDNDLNLTNFNKRYNNAALMGKDSTSAENGTEQPKLTFEQYVRKLTGSYTVNKALEVVDAANSSSTSSLTSQLTNTPRFSLKIAPAPSSATKTVINQTSVTPTSATKAPLTVPIINPAIKAVLDKYNSQSTKPLVVNGDAKSSSVKIITVNQSPATSSATAQLAANKKYLIINNNIANNTTPTAQTPIKTATVPVSATNTPNNMIKIINISQLNGNRAVQTPKTAIISPVMSRPQIIMINTNGLAKTAASSAPAQQILTAIPINNSNTVSLVPANSENKVGEQQISITPSTSQSSISNNVLPAESTAN